MATHHWYCAWCGVGTGCCADEHMLACGQVCCCDSEIIKQVKITSDYKPTFTIKVGQPQPLEFCSAECFQALLRDMNKRLEISRREYPEWFKDGR